MGFTFRVVVLHSDDPATGGPGIGDDRHDIQGLHSEQVDDTDKNPYTIVHTPVKKMKPTVAKKKKNNLEVSRA